MIDLLFLFFLLVFFAIGFLAGRHWQRGEQDVRDLEQAERMRAAIRQSEEQRMNNLAGYMEEFAQEFAPSPMHQAVSTDESAAPLPAPAEAPAGAVSCCRHCPHCH